MSESATTTAKATKLSAFLCVGGIALVLWFSSERRPIFDQVARWAGLSDSLEVSLKVSRQPDYANPTQVSIVNRSKRPVTIQKVQANGKENCINKSIKKLGLGDEHTPFFYLCGKIVEVEITTDDGSRTYTFD
jgi:hypothetical protein